MPRLAVTLGDPAGIGPAIAARAIAAFMAGQGKATDTYPARLLAIGPLALLQAELARARLPLKLVPVTASAPWEDIPDGVLPVLDPAPKVALPEPGAPSAEGGQIALAAVDAAIDLAVAGTVDGIVTAPLSKEAVRLAGNPDFIGHTEHLASRCGHAPVRMMMTCPQLTVVLVTTHLALAEVPHRITAEAVFDTLRMTDAALAMHMGIANPRIAVCGLNPHPGEFGREDEMRVVPAIRKAQAAGLAVEGPLSADALFARVVRDSSHDAVVAMYHDQGLTPLKLLGFETAVNITLGLPFVRTSPDHGTAYDIAAGRKNDGVADPSSMVAALECAVRWTTRNRV
ncbi:MAG: 4-hydroxythreonine-4-phosphate dehydrogenase PdxA [Nitrospirota bacterium]|nr:4-hydroxythreonine-4-phosphate dehydrogenase PdxA [Nitrospirota bacterium]